jgi:N-acetylmuramoyl-L-alanine amidase
MPPPFPTRALLLAAFLTLAAAAAPAQNTIRVEFADSASRTTVVGSFLRGKTVYASLSDFLRILNASSYENSEAKKVEIKRGALRVKLTGANPFVVITDGGNDPASVQLTDDVLYAAGAFFVPLRAFLPFFQTCFGIPASYSDENRTLRIGGQPATQAFDIPSIAIEPKLNGLLIRIATTRQLTDYESWLRSDGWLYVTIAGAKADTATINATACVHPVREIVAIQSPTSVQLTFRLAGQMEFSEMVADDSTREILVAVRAPLPVKHPSVHDTTDNVTANHPPAGKKPAPAALPRISPPPQPRGAVPVDLDDQRKRWSLDVIVLDAGHGGHDPGTIGVTGVREKNVTLGIVLKLGKLLEKAYPDLKVVYTRKTDKFIELDRRGKIANEAGGKLFISVHCNALARKPSPLRGFEVYLLRPGRTDDAIAIAERENSVIELEEGYEERYQQLTEENFILVTMAQSAYVKASEVFADLAQKQLAAKTKLPNRGVKQAGFYVLVGTAMPNVLVETAYLSNRDDERFLSSEAGQKKIADALFQAVQKYKREYEKLLKEGKTDVE